MIAGIGDVQGIAQQRDTHRPAHRRLATAPVQEVGVARAELAHDTALMRAFEHPMIAAVDDVDVLVRNRKPSRKTQWHRRLGAGENWGLPGHKQAVVAVEQLADNSPHHATASHDDPPPVKADLAFYPPHTPPTPHNTQ